MSKRTRNVLLIALVVAALGLASRFLLAPWIVKLYYVRLLDGAVEITIRSRIGSPQPVTIRRSTDPDAFTTIQTAVRNGYVRPYTCKCYPTWELDLRTQSGARTRIGACHYLDSARQPLRGHLWFYPRRHLAGEPDLPDEIRRIRRSASPAPSGDGPSSEARAMGDSGRAGGSDERDLWEP